MSDIREELVNKIRFCINEQMNGVVGLIIDVFPQSALENIQYLALKCEETTGVFSGDRAVMMPIECVDAIIDFLEQYKTGHLDKKLAGAECD